MIDRTFTACLLLAIAVPAAAPVVAKPARLKGDVAVSALLEQRPGGFVNARQIYSWSDGAVFQIDAAPERISDIALQPGEELVSVAAGDTARWIIGDTTSGSGPTKRTHLLVKPVASGLSTNVMIATDRRTYHLALTSRANSAMTAVAWTYPPGDLLALQRKIELSTPPAAASVEISPERLNFAYAISGDRPHWRPLRAFDDGRQVFIQFPVSLSQGDAPPLFILGDKGEAQLVNYRVRGRLYVVDRLFDRAELRLGEKKQVIVRISRTALDAGRS